MMKIRRFSRMMAISACAGLGTAAIVSIAQTRVVSNNVVGYFTLTVNRGTMVMLRNDFLGQDGETPTPEAVFGSSLPAGTEILLWDTTKTPPSYTISEYKATLGPPPTFTATTNWTQALSLNRGTGFWLKIPETAPQEVYTVLVAGTVPDDTEHSAPIAENLNMAAYAFPADVLWTNTSLAKSASEGDEVYLWRKNESEGTWGYQINTYKTTLGPPPTFTPTTEWTIKDMVIPVGRAIWYRSATAKTWTEDRPYPAF